MVFNGQVVFNGFDIYSDCWAAYRQIQGRLGFEHGTVNHRFNFVDPVTGVHTQNVESYWNRLKRKIKAMNGLREESLPRFLANSCGKTTIEKERYMRWLDCWQSKNK